jgi:hypothetical protein
MPRGQRWDALDPSQPAVNSKTVTLVGDAYVCHSATARDSWEEVGARYAKRSLMGGPGAVHDAY